MILLVLVLVVLFLLVFVGHFSFVEFFKSIPYTCKDIYLYFKEKRWKVFNEFGLVVYLGTFGKGKTLSAVSYVFDLHKRYPDIPIYSNIDLFGVKYTPLTSFQQIVEINEKAIVLVDEMGVMFNNRAFGDFPLALLDNILQCRHIGLLIVGTAQKYEDLDMIIRKNITEVREVKKLWSRLIGFDIYDGYDCYYSQIDYHNIKPKFIGKFCCVTDNMRKSYNTLQIATNIKSPDVVSDVRKQSSSGHNNNLVVKTKKDYSKKKWSGNYGR